MASMVPECSSQARSSHLKASSLSPNAAYTAAISSAGRYFVAANAFCSSRIFRASDNRPICKRNHFAHRDRLGGCQQPRLPQPEVDALIEAFTVRTLTDADALTRIIDESIRRTSEVVHPFPAATTDTQLTALKQKDKRLLEAYEGGAVTLDELRTRREGIKTQIASLQRRTEDQEQQRDMSTEEFARKVVRGAFRFKRITDRKEKKAVILSLFSDLYLKDRSIIAFKFRDDLGMKSGVKLGPGFGTPAIHLDEPFTLAPVDPPPPEGMRRCSCCRKVLAATEFYPRKGQCRRCIATKAHAAHLHRRATRGET